MTIILILVMRKKAQGGSKCSRWQTIIQTKWQNRSLNLVDIILHYFVLYLHGILELI
jgi:hypothetical protein